MTGFGISLKDAEQKHNAQSTLWFFQHDGFV
jgi:hypothetical protein